MHLRCVKDLENAVDTLNAEFEAIEALKVEVMPLTKHKSSNNLTPALQELGAQALKQSFG